MNHCVPIPTPQIWNLLPAPHLPCGSGPCTCSNPDVPRTTPLQLIVLTGGPGSGKSAVLRAAAETVCRHVAFIPEAATILFGGGFPRHRSWVARAAAQRAIFAVQREGERLVEDERQAVAALCDRGTVDGVAYWPHEAGSYWEQVGEARDDQVRRYGLVIHLRPPNERDGYDHSNPVRTEDAATARELDLRIEEAWDGHPNRVIIPASVLFEEKLHAALTVIGEWLSTNAQLTR